MATFSAAPAVPNFEESASPSLFTSLTAETAENSVSRVGIKADNVDQSPAVPASNDEKWSSEALFTAEAITYGGRSASAARSKARPGRMQKLKLAEVLRENPGVEFLAECWNDDPALQIVIRK